MNLIKKILLFLILVFCLFVSSSLAVDINVHPNNTSTNNITNNSTSNSSYNNETSVNRTTQTPAVSTSTTSSRYDNKKLTLSDIIDIIVASIGIVNILLGIAIIIRFK